MSIRFIAGPDDFLVLRKALREWENMSLRFGEPEALEIIDGLAGNVDEVRRAVTAFVSAVQTVSMFAPQKAVWFRNISFLADNVTGRAAGTAEEVERLQACLETHDAENVDILLSASPVDRRKKFYKWLQNNSNSSFIEPGKDAQAVMDLIQEEAAALGVDFAGDAARILAEKVGSNTRMAIAETRKLATYLGADGGSITPAMVAELVPNSAESDFFEATEAFFSLDLPTTLAAIQRHFFCGHDARPLIASLQNRNRLMIQLKALISGGALPPRISQNSLSAAASRYGEYFGTDGAKSAFNVFSQNPYYLGRLADALRDLSLRDLLHFQDIFRAAFLEIISRPNEQEAVIRAMAISCLSRPAGVRGA